MEYLNLALIILSIYLYNSKKKIKKHSEILETNYHDLQKKYNAIKSELENYSSQSEITKTSKRNNEKTSSVTQEDIIAFSEKRIERQYLYPQKDLADKSHSLYGKKVVITGDFNHFSSRNEIAKLLWEVGADVDTGVGKNTQALIVGDNPGPSKMMLAEDMNIEFITENEFLNLFENEK